MTTTSSLAVTETFRVSGMTCGHCVHAVTTEVSKIAGVRQVGVELPSGIVTVSGDQPVSRAALAAAIDEAGYELRP